MRNKRGRVAGVLPLQVDVPIQALAAVTTPLLQRPTSLLPSAWALAGSAEMPSLQGEASLVLKVCFQCHLSCD